MSRKYLDIFCCEAQERLASLQSGLLVLERHPGRKELLEELLRDAHTLKGSARMVSLDHISAITHSMEEQLKEMEEGSRSIDAAGIDLLLKGSDAVALITSAISKGETPALDLERFLDEYSKAAGVSPPSPPSPPDSSDSSDQSDQPEQPSETVRAEVKTLDALVNLIGEMIINKKRLEVKLSRLREIAARSDQETAALLFEFRRQLEEDVLCQDYLIQELHEKALALRMLPLKSITDGFQRLVRDLCQKLGKEATLVMTGGAIEMDRVLLEGLKPMLIHLLTNAVCHGLESPAERRAAGKEPRGTVWLTARHEGNWVVVEVRDDGRGMDPARIRKTAVRQGLIGEREAEELRDEEALYLTLRQGFSTAETVTDVAGRGVGMDVVKKNVERVEGNLTLTSEPGRYLEVSLQLPLTLSVLEALTVESGGETFVVPISYLQEIVKVHESEITTTGDGETIKLRGATVPFFSLGALMGLAQPVAGDGSRCTAVVLRHCDQRMACAVDAQLGNSVVVVKGLGKQFRSVDFVFGATILGDGNPALILNVPDLFAAGGAESRQISRRGRQAVAPSRARVLVVDDSATTRAMERNILIGNGYQVETAVSGEDALEKTAAAEGFDLILTDLEMPGIDGFQLTRLLRASERYRDTPIVVVSSLAGDADKQQALEAGAQAYIVKGAFDQTAFLDTVRTLLS